MSDISEQESSQFYGEDDSPYSNSYGGHHDTGFTIQTSVKDNSTSRTSFSPRLKELLLNELKAPTTVFHCVQHPEEELQFYCVDDNRLLCTDCVVAGGHVGHQVLNFKKATGQIMQRLDDLLSDMGNRIKLCDMWESKVEARKEDLSEIITDYKNKIIVSMEELHKRIEMKQEKLLQEADQLYTIKMQEIEVAIQAINNRQDEILTIKNTIQEKVSGLDELSVCQYYSTRVNMIRGFINDEDGLQSLIRPLTEDKDFEESFSLDKFQDEIQLIMLQLRSLKGIEDERELTELARYSPAKLKTNFPTFNTQTQTMNSDANEVIRHQDNYSEEEEENAVKAHWTTTGNSLNSANHLYFNKSGTKGQLIGQDVHQSDENQPLSFRTRSQNIYQSFNKILELRKRSEKKLKAALDPIFSNGGHYIEEKSQRKSFTQHKLREKDENPISDYNLHTPSTGLLSGRKTTRRQPQLSVDCNRKSALGERESSVSAKTSYLPESYSSVKLRKDTSSAQLDIHSSLLSPIWSRSSGQKIDIFPRKLNNTLLSQTKRLPISLMKTPTSYKSHSLITDSPGLLKTTQKWTEVFRSQLFKS